MRHILLVANQTSKGDSTDSVGRASRTTMRSVTEVLGGWHEVGGAEARAAPDARYQSTRQRLDHALERLRDVGAFVAGKVGQDDALAAVVEITRRHQFDEIIISTLPRRVSRWLRQGLPSRVERTTRLHVTVVTGA